MPEDLPEMDVHMDLPEDADMLGKIRTGMGEISVDSPNIIEKLQAKARKPQQKSPPSGRS